MLGQGNGELGRNDTFLNRLFFSLTPFHFPIESASVHSDETARQLHLLK